MATVHTHRDLIAWQEAIRLVEIVYRDTAGFPSEETFGLKNQLRRSAVSVPSNIAEGSARNTTGELVQFLGIARGSLAELETQLVVATRLGLLNEAVNSIKQVDRVGRLLSALLKSLISREARSRGHAAV
jgi:four helix bundle protein